MMNLASIFSRVCSKGNTQLLIATFLFLAVTAIAFTELRAEAPAIESINDFESLQVIAPYGWSKLQGLSESIEGTAQNSAFFGEEETTAKAVAYGEAGRGAIYVTRVFSKRAIVVPEDHIRKSLSFLRNQATLGDDPESQSKELSYSETRAGNTVQFELAWTHLKNETTTHQKGIFWKDQDSRLHLGIAECVQPTQISEASKGACKHGLRSFRLSKSVNPLPLGQLPDTANPAPAPPPIEELPPLQTGENKLKQKDSPPGPTLNNAPQSRGKVLYSGPPAKKESNRNTILIGLGLALVGIAIYLTTRNRQEDKSNPAADQSAE